MALLGLTSVFVISQMHLRPCYRLILSKRGKVEVDGWKRPPCKRGSGTLKKFMQRVDVWYCCSNKCGNRQPTLISGSVKFSFLKRKKRKEKLNSNARTLMTDRRFFRRVNRKRRDNEVEGRI